MRTDFVIIFVTSSSSEEAGRITSSLLKKRLIACSNTIPRIESRFWWKGKIDKAKEVLILMKARDRDFPKIEKEVKRLHSYEVPEIIAVPIIAGSKEYLGWIEENIKE